MRMVNGSLTPALYTTTGAPAESSVSMVRGDPVPNRLM